MDPNGICQIQGYGYDVGCIRYVCGKQDVNGIKKVTFYTAKTGEYVKRIFFVRQRV